MDQRDKVCSYNKSIFANFFRGILYWNQWNVSITVKTNYLINHYTQALAQGCTIWVVIFGGLKFRVMWICYKLEIFVDINFSGCFISCALLYLPKYVAMETMQFSLVTRGHNIAMQGSMGTYTWPDFTVWKGKQQHILTFCCFHNKWWRNCGPRAMTNFSCMCTVLAASWVNSVNVSVYS